MPLDVLAVGLGVVGFSAGIDCARRARNRLGREESGEKSVPLLQKLKRCRWTTSYEKVTELTDELTLQRSPSVCSLNGTPLDFECPLTLELLDEPVKASDGKVYEKTAIELWLSGGNTTSPITGAELTSKKLVPDKKLRDSIRRWKARGEMTRVSILLLDFGTIAGLCVAERAGVDGADSNLVVTQVLCESQAAAQGARPGDVLETINGAPVASEGVRDMLATADRPLELVLARAAKGDDPAALRALQKPQAGSHLLL